MTRLASLNPAQTGGCLQELKEVQNDDSAEYIAEAVEDNIFEWHYVIRGPAETEFAVRTVLQPAARLVQGRPGS